MNNKELQDLLRQYPDNMLVYFETDADPIEVEYADVVQKRSIRGLKDKDIILLAHF